MKKIISILVILAFISIQGKAQIPANLELQTIASFNSPLTVRHAGDGSGRLFIVEKGGTIRIFNGTSVLTTPFLDISSKVTNSGERGLLGLDFDPNYSANGYFYVNYNTSDGNLKDTIIERYQVSTDNANIANPDSGQILMRIDQPFTNHNGGDIHFGPDGYLYIGMGDGGDGDDPMDHGQNTSTLLGAMLRVDVNPDIIFKNSHELDNSCGLDASNYYIPKDNPFVQDTNSCGEIWSYGLRNPWRWSFDKLTGDLIIGDVGQSGYEEVDFQASTNTGGDNYGWRCREGAHDYILSNCSLSDVYVDPVIDLPRQGDNNCSVIGGYVYRGPIVDLQGDYIFSDFCDGEINFATPGVGQWPYSMWFDASSTVSAFGEDEQGNIYIIIGNTVYMFGLAP